jgi:hypothetical protein
VNKPVGQVGTALGNAFTDKLDYHYIIGKHSFLNVADHALGFICYLISLEEGLLNLESTRFQCTGS